MYIYRNIEGERDDKRAERDKGRRNRERER